MSKNVPCIVGDHEFDVDLETWIKGFEIVDQVWKICVQPNFTEGEPFGGAIWVLVEHDGEDQAIRVSSKFTDHSVIGELVVHLADDVAFGIERQCEYEVVVRVIGIKLFWWHVPEGHIKEQES